MPFMKNENVWSSAYGWAKEKHDATGILYNGVPYFEGHVAVVCQTLFEHGFITPLWQARGACHDVIEDCCVPRDEMRELFGMEVELPTWCVTGIGETRKIRNSNIYSKIVMYSDLMNEHAPAIVKCADRITHFKTSVSGSLHRQMYVKELSGFAEVIKHRVPETMWNHLESIAVL